MKLPFTKMQAAGNDYIYVNGFDVTLSDPGAVSRSLSRRHFSVGGDGLVLILPPDDSAVADARMQMFNADGSEGLMCGNAIRCVGKYLYERGFVAPDRRELAIETASGQKYLTLHVTDGTVETVTVDMGEVIVADADVVANLPATTTEDTSTWKLRPVSVGNPHAVTFLRELDRVDVAAKGVALSTAARETFPDGVNVEFAALTDYCVLRMRVCERGTGVTLACGTGACATAAAVATGRCPADTDITVRLDGGTLTVRITPEGHAMMTGPAHFVFDGVAEI